MKGKESGSGFENAKTPWKPRYAERMRGVQASEIRELLKLIDQPGMISFAGGIPDPALFPTKRIQSIYDSILSDRDEACRALQYSVSEGDAELRSWVANHMQRRGVPCSAENILITNGSQQALEFLGKLFISPKDRVTVTAPTYLGALQAFAPSQPIYATLRVPDNENAFIDEMGTHSGSGDDAFAYVVPDFANPTGVTLNKRKRREILALAADRDMPVIEDSPYEMLRFNGTPEAPMQALDIEDCGSIDASRVIYCGSFSKVFTPGLRVGWVCASREIISQLTLIKQSSDLNSPAINQQVMLHLAREFYDEQVELACGVYRDKRDAMLENLGNVLPAGSQWTRPEGGMFIWATLPDEIDTRSLLKMAGNEHGVAFVPGGAFHADGTGLNTLRLSYTLPSVDQIEIGLKRLGDAISKAYR